MERQLPDNVRYAVLGVHLFLDSRNCIHTTRPSVTWFLLYGEFPIMAGAGDEKSDPNATAYADRLRPLVGLLTTYLRVS